MNPSQNNQYGVKIDYFLLYCLFGFGIGLAAVFMNIVYYGMDAALCVRGFVLDRHFAVCFA